MRVFFPIYRAACALLLLAVLNACSSDPSQRALVAQALHPRQQQAPDPQFVALAQSGAPLMVVAVENRARAYTQFARQSRTTTGVESWISGDHLSLGVSKGVIVATRGFGGDMMSADVTRLGPLVAERREGIAELFLSHLDGEDQVRISAYRCRVTRRGARQVDLGAYQADTSLMVADCRNGDAAFRNLYWVEDRTGQIVQSKQWIGPFAGTVATRVIPPQRRDQI